MQLPKAKVKSFITIQFQSNAHQSALIQKITQVIHILEGIQNQHMTSILFVAIRKQFLASKNNQYQLDQCRSKTQIPTINIQDKEHLEIPITTNMHFPIQ